MTRLAILGAGIGGCSAAYFAHKYLPNAKVTLYDSQERIGGRILTQKVYGNNLELGATFFNGANRTILGFVNDLKLNFERVEEYGDFLIWDGSKTVFKSNKNAALNNFKLFSKYHSSVLNVLRFLNKAKKHLSQFYLQEQKNPAEIDSLFESSGLKEYCLKPFDTLLTEAGLNQKFINEAASPITRTIYSQNADLGGFAGVSSLIGVYGYPIYRFTEGNNAFPARLAEASHAFVKQRQKVSSIEKMSNDSYRVISGKETEVFDCIIIAAPLELANITFDGMNVPNWMPQQFQSVFTRVMRGVFDPTFFGLKAASQTPAIVLTTKEADPLKHCSIQKIENNESLVTFTSTKPIPDDLFNGVFKSKATPVLEHSWKAAYPKFKPLSKLPPNRLDKGLFYVNAVESAVSSMETSAFSALNCVRMLNADLT
jgi:prenylcysteine oxidase / farnesylcysteine lyase